MQQPTMPTAVSWITRRPHWDEGIEACIRDTNINVWLLVVRRQLGMTEAEILEDVQGLTLEDLQVAWAYYADHPEEIDRAIQLYEEA